MSKASMPLSQRYKEFSYVEVLRDRTDLPD